MVVRSQVIPRAATRSCRKLNCEAPVAAMKAAFPFRAMASRSRDAAFSAAAFAITSAVAWTDTFMVAPSLSHVRSFRCGLLSSAHGVALYIRQLPERQQNSIPGLAGNRARE